MLSYKFTPFAGREMILFQYCSPIVISEAVGMFLLFLRIKSVHKIKFVGILANSSLVVYLIHMHPIIKNNYVQWNIFGWVNVSNPIIMIIQLTTVVFCVYGVGVVLSIPLNKAATVVSNKVVNYVTLKKL